MNNKEINWKNILIKIALLAAFNIALIVGLAPLSFGPFQFRISNLMNIFPFIFGLPGLIGVFLGGLIANFLNPFGILDILLGGVLSGGVVLGFAYFCGCQARKYNKKQPWLFLALIASPIGTTFFVGYLLLHVIFQIPLWPLVPYFIAEELLTSTFGGWLVYKAISRYLQGKGVYDLPN